MGITAARDTLDAALGQKVQTAGGMIVKPCQIGRQKNRRGTAPLYLRIGPAPIRFRVRMTEIL
jgi:hypothetical protein